MRWLKLTILVLGFAILGERSAQAQFFGPPGWGYHRGGISLSLNFGSAFGYSGYGYGPSFYPPYPIYRPPLYYVASPPPLVVVRQPPIIVIDRRPTFELREPAPQPDPGPIPKINANVKPANMLVIRPENEKLPAPRVVPDQPDDAELKQAEADLEAARQRLNAILRAKGK